MIWGRGVRAEGPALLWPGLSRGIVHARSFDQTEWCRDLKAYFLRARVIIYSSPVHLWVTGSKKSGGDKFSHTLTYQLGFTLNQARGRTACGCANVLQFCACSYHKLHCVLCWSCLWNQTSLGLSSSLILTAWVTLGKRCHLSSPHLPHLQSEA